MTPLHALLGQSVEDQSRHLSRVVFCTPAERFEMGDNQVPLPDPGAVEALVNANPPVQAQHPSVIPPEVEADAPPNPGPVNKDAEARPDVSLDELIFHLMHSLG